MADENLEKLLEQYKSHFEPDKQKEQSNLSTTVGKVFTKAMDEFLGEMHGKDKNGMPKSYHLGTEKHNFADAGEHAEELFNRVGMQLLSYAFPDAKEDELKKIEELYKKDPAHIEGMMRSKFGIDKQEFMDEMVKYRNNVFNSEDLPALLNQAGNYIASTDKRLLGKKIFKHKYFDQLKDHVSKHINKLAPEYGIHKDRLTMQDLPNLVENIYSQGHRFKNYIKNHRQSYKVEKK